ncbi:ABC transporter permease [Micromonospora sp. NPDC023737]|uniref:ABC transporter permease n=1 Tax=unclassified Micromonospora TaxID=2617518 RepID=UPI0033FDCD5B
MTALTGRADTRKSGAPKRRPHLSGLSWLVWRQHRTGFWTILAVTAIGIGLMAYWRAGMVDYLVGYGYPHLAPDEWQSGFEPFSKRLFDVGYYLGFLPILLGVFLGAPLIAGDLEAGTTQLVLGHSVSRTRWLAAKLTIAGLVVVVSTGALSLTFWYWWSPVSQQDGSLDWTSGKLFDVTGAVPVALALLTVVGGVAIGMLLRRTLIAMVATFGFAVLVQVIWSRFRLNLGTPVTFTSHNGVADGPPGLPAGAHQLGQGPSFLTDSGQVLPWQTCVEQSETAKAHLACLAAKHVDGWSMDYLPYSQMQGMQWLGSAILLVLTAAIIVFVFLWGRKRLV